MAYFSIMCIQLFMLAVYTLCGVLAVKCKVLDKAGLAVISKLITKLTLPLLIFTNTLNGATAEQFSQSAVVLFYGILLYLFLFPLTFGMAKAFHLIGNEAKVFQACYSFGNMGFMGIPIISALFPEKGMTYIALFTVVDQIMLWTVGVTMTIPVNADGSKLTKEQRMENMKKMINPCTIGILLSVVMVLAGIGLPGPLNTALTKTGQMTTPMAMIFVGGSFCYTKLGDILKKYYVYVAVVVKMLVFPLAFVMILHAMGAPDELAVSFGVIAGLPTMSSVAMLAQQHNCEPEMSSGLIFITTIASVITMPLICILTGILL